MYLIACVDNRWGLGFNNRRLSKDSQVLNQISSIVGESTIYVDSQYSKNLLSDYVKNVEIIDENTNINEFEYVFIDNKMIELNEDDIVDITIYNWNRNYPSDTKFELDNNIWKEADTEDFLGSSHGIITRTKYIRG